MSTAPDNAPCRACGATYASCDDRMRPTTFCCADCDHTPDLGRCQEPTFICESPATTFCCGFALCAPCLADEHECDGLHDAEDLRVLGQVGTAAAHMALTEGFAPDRTTALPAPVYPAHQLIPPLGNDPAEWGAAMWVAITGTYGRPADIGTEVLGTSPLVREFQLN